jgi:hypothetical protein
MSQIAYSQKLIDWEETNIASSAQSQCFAFNLTKSAGA